MISKSMQARTMHQIVQLLFIFTVLGFSCCSTNRSPEQTASDSKGSDNKARNIFQVKSPIGYQTVRFEEGLELKLSSKKAVVPDSIVATNNGKRLLVTGEVNQLTYSVLPNTESFGRKSIKLTVYHSDSIQERLSVNIMHLPKSEPEELFYRVIRSFPHDPTAYTQGLIYKDGLIFESTGQQNHSSLRAIDPKTGDILRKKTLAPQYFGEGIAAVGNEIYMLTYRAQLGFVFDQTSFELIRKFNLQTQEGWGLSGHNDTLILSDGSANLFFFLPDDYFTLVGQKEICDNKGLIDSINELEITPDGLYANIYDDKNVILRIDFRKGIVTHKLDLSELFPENVPRNADYVLNGIAYNKENDSFYVTGKQWPVMYEIKVTPN